ncbi:hypothetical protein GW813_07855 [bacterium]|nr:hypothetical protein [bacterium]
MTRHLAGIFLLSAVLMVAGCGTTDQTTLPEDTNPFAAAAIGTDSTLEVVSWNVESFPKNGQTTVEDLAQAVEALDADIVALQEIKDAAQFKALDATLTGYQGFRAGSAGYDINLAYLYKTDGLLTVESIYEILTRESDLPRSPLVLQGTFGDAPFVVIDNHYKCCGNNQIDLTDSWDEETRRLNANLALQAYIEENFAGMSVIMVGDFNDELTDGESNNVFQNFISDPERYRFADMSIAQGPSSGWSYPSWPSHLDHVLVTAPLFLALDKTGSDVRVVRLDNYFSSGWSAYDKNISDHLPIFIRVTP